MHEEEKVIYPQNIYLKGLLAVSPETTVSLAEKIGHSRRVISLTINGRYKGGNIIPKIFKALGIDFLKENKALIPAHLHETLFTQEPAN